MFLYQDLVLALILSVLFSLLFATAKVVGKNKKHPQFDEVDHRVNDGVSEFADHVFDEIPVRPGCDYDVAEAEEGGDNVGSVEKLRSFGFEFEEPVFDESPVMSESREVALEIKGICDLEGEVSKESVFNGVVLKEDFVESMDRAKSGEIAMVKNEILKECSLGELEFEEHIVDEIQDRAKDHKFAAESEKNYNISKVLQEVKIRSEILEKSISSGIEFEESIGDENTGRVKEERDYDMDQIERFKVLESKDLRRSENESDVDESWLDDWEGIERTELKKKFGDAVVFVGSKENAHFILSFDKEVKMKLYGLHKVAIEGACCVQQPLALKVSARLKWNAWNLLGDMSREVAMEKYIALLSKSLPEWRGGDHQEKE